MFLVSNNYFKKYRGMTLLELLISLAMAALLIAGISNTVSQTLQIRDEIIGQETLQRDLDFAFSRMVRLTRNSRTLILPLSDNPSTDWPENIREETIPSSTPVGSSTNATAVLSVTLPESWDLDANGIPDADNDGDGLIDEDLPNDTNNDFHNGLKNIDDDGDGYIDESSSGSSLNNDDEGGSNSGEDPINGIDDDSDGTIDEDSASDMNDDGCQGICDVDDNGDGLIDDEGSGSSDDDDEDGHDNEDWYDTVAYYLSNGMLMERIPVPWDEDAQGAITGADYVTNTLTENVTHLSIERIDDTSNGILVKIELVLTAPDGGYTAQAATTVRVGGNL